MFKELRHTGTIYVPAVRVSALEAVKASALHRAGGYTAVPGEGGWEGPDGERHVQPVVVVEALFEELGPMVDWVNAGADILRGYGEVAVLTRMQSGEGVTQGLQQ